MMILTTELEQIHLSEDKVHHGSSQGPFWLKAGLESTISPAFPVQYVHSAQAPGGTNNCFFPSSQKCVSVFPHGLAPHQ